MQYVMFTSVENTEYGPVSVISGVEKAAIDRMATMRRISADVHSLNMEIQRKIESGELDIHSHEAVDESKAEFGSQVARLFQENAVYMCPAGGVLIDDKKAAAVNYELLSLGEGMALTLDLEPVRVVRQDPQEPSYTEETAIRELLLTIVSSDVPIEEIVSSIRKKLSDSRGTGRRPPSHSGVPGRSDTRG